MKSLDRDNNNRISKEELEQGKELLELNLREDKAAAHKKMAYLALLSMIVYAFLPLIPYVPVTRLASIEAISTMFLLSMASIVGFYFGVTAYMTKN